MTSFQTITGPYADSVFQGLGMRTDRIRHLTPSTNAIIEITPRPLLSDLGVQPLTELGHDLEFAENYRTWKCTIPRATLVSLFGDWATAETAIGPDQIWEISVNDETWNRYRTPKDYQRNPEGDRYEITLVEFVGYEDAYNP